MEMLLLIPLRSCIPSVQVVKTQKEHRVGPIPKPKVKASLTAKPNVSLGVNNPTAATSYNLSTLPVFPNKTEPLLSTTAYFICIIHHKQLPPNTVFKQKPIANQLTWSWSLSCSSNPLPAFGWLIIFADSSWWNYITFHKDQRVATKIIEKSSKNTSFSRLLVNQAETTPKL